MSNLERIVLLKLNDKRKSPVLPKELEGEVAKRIGSEFKPGTRDCIRGLDPVQERILLPDILGLQPQDAQFPSKSREYWADMTITPTVEGLRLNVATTKAKAVVNGKEEEYDLPVAPEDYMIYKIALQSSKVASEPHEIENSDQFDFILIDLFTQKAKEEEAYKERKEATLAFARLVAGEGSSNKEKIDWVIQLLKDEREYLDLGMSDTDKEIYLDKKMVENPTKFLKVVNDKNLETKAFLKKAIAVKEIVIEGENFFLGDTNLGPIRSAVEWIKNPENSGKVLALRSRIENTLRNTKQ